MKDSDIERFFAKVNKDQLSPGGCWEWTGYRTKKGYGAFYIKVGGREDNWRAHRTAWYIEHKAMPSCGGQVLHLCNNPSCCNPAHLYEGTNADNMRYKREQGRAAKGENNSLAKLTAEDVLEIRRLSGTESYSSLSKMFNVTSENISYIVRRVTWKHI